MIDYLELNAQGGYAHHFWGTYSAELYLDVPTVPHPESLAGWLQNITGCTWDHKEKDGRLLLATYLQSADESDRVKTIMESLRPEDDSCPTCGKRHEIGDLAHSIDYGAPFTITIPVQRPGQLELAL